MSQVKSFIIRLNQSPYIVYFLIALSTQLAQVIKPFPSSTVNHCNYRIELSSFAFVRLDCDAGYFLLDSQSPSRFLTTESPFLDRPLPALLVFLASQVLRLISIPPFPITYFGEDGIPQTYFALNYLLFVLLNSFYLLLAIYFSLKLLNEKVTLNDNTVLLSLVITLSLAQNRISAEYFWTPHTIIMNITIPALLAYVTLTDNIEKQFSRLYFLGFLLLFVYPTTILFLTLLIFRQKRGFSLKFLLLALPTIVYLALPKFLELFGSENSNTLLTQHKRFLWLLPKNSTSSEVVLDDALFDYVSRLVTTIPLSLISTAAILCTLIFRSIWIDRTLLARFSLRNYSSRILLTVIFYGLFLIGSGNLVPRQTIGIALFLIISLLVILAEFQNEIKQISLRTLSLFVLTLNCVVWLMPRGIYL